MSERLFLGVDLSHHWEPLAHELTVCGTIKIFKLIEPMMNSNICSFEFPLNTCFLLFTEY